MIVLNIYALCRIDDISWGTKGLDSDENDKSDKLKESWKVIKYIHISKYFFWNIVVGSLLLTFGASYAARFYITFSLMAILVITQLLKTITGLIYNISYNFSNNKIGRASEYNPDRTILNYSPI
jgi:hypothetical protein